MAQSVVCVQIGIVECDVRVFKFVGQMKLQITVTVFGSLHVVLVLN